MQPFPKGQARSSRVCATHLQGHLVLAVRRRRHVLPLQHLLHLWGVSQG